MPAVACWALSADDLAAELLTTVLEADPLAGSLYGIPGYDDLLPDYGVDAEREHARALASVAERAEQMPDTGLSGQSSRRSTSFATWRGEWPMLLRSR